MKKFLRWTVLAAAVAYPLALLLVVAAFRWVGERWSLATIGLYLPRAGFALPLPLLVVALLIARAFRWLLSPILATWILLFPLMGLHLGSPRPQAQGTLRMTVLTLNMGFGHGGLQPVIALIRDTHADVVTLAAVGGRFEELREGLPGFTFVRDEELAIGSRFPLDEFVVGAPIVRDGAGARDGGTEPGMSIRCRLTTPAGRIRVYAVHPSSPHNAFDEIRGGGLRGELLSGRIFGAEARRQMSDNTTLRLAQLGAVAAAARTSPDPVLIGGDTNLPELSQAFARFFGDYHDAFAETGRGFGYTYPADTRRPWMRIDRILAGPRFRVLSAFTPPRHIYKHLAVVADVELRPE